MQHFADLFGKASGIIGLAALAPYIYSILKRKTKPSRASWLIWAVLSIIILLSYHASGATTTIWLPVSYAVIAVVVFLLSLKYGVGGYARLDIFCLAGAAVGLLLWKFTHNPANTLYLTLFIDTFGFIPTIKKAYLDPTSESKLSWTIAMVALVFNVAAITSWQFKIALYPIWEFIFNGLVTIMLYDFIQKRFKPTSG